MIDLEKELQLNKDDTEHQKRASSDRWLKEALDEAFQNGEKKSQTPKSKRACIEEKLKRNWKWLALEAGAALLAVLLVFNLVIGVCRVSGDSMKPNICNGDKIVMLRLVGTIEKGDIIVFKTDNGDKLIKRVVATDGDTVDIGSQGGLYINGELTAEDYIYTATGVIDESVQYPVTVGEDCYFVLGDNRPNSTDSRTASIGLVEKKDIVGRVVLDIKGV